MPNIWGKLLLICNTEQTSLQRKHFTTYSTYTAALGTEERSQSRLETPGEKILQLLFFNIKSRKKCTFRNHSHDISRAGAHRSGSRASEVSEGSKRTKQPE